VTIIVQVSRIMGRDYNNECF